MAADRITIISADCHAGPLNLAGYKPYIEPRFRADFDDYLARVDAYEAGYSDGLSNGGAPTDLEAGLYDKTARASYLDEDGISAEIIFEQGSIPFGIYPAVGARPEFLNFKATNAQSAAGCRAYNRWLADLCSSAPDRHLGIAHIPIQDIDAAATEVAFARKAGLRGGVRLPSLARGDLAPYNDRSYDRLWAACADHQMTLNMHGGSGLTYGSGPERLAINLAETDFMSRRGIAHLMFAGVFERYPGLHLAMTEQRAHWATPMLAEYDSVYRYSYKQLSAYMPRLPSEYFLSNCFVGASFMSRPECDARGDIGAACFMWGSDYPHREGTWPHTDTALRWTFGGDVPSNQLRDMLGRNAARCYYMDYDALRSIGDRIGPSEAHLRAAPEKVPGRDPDVPYVRSWAFRHGGVWH